MNPYCNRPLSSCPKSVLFELVSSIVYARLRINTDEIAVTVLLS